jgi:hypothetical protein
MEYRRWMLQMQTRAVVSRVLLVSRWTMYSSVSLKLLSGEAYWVSTPLRVWPHFFASIMPAARRST